MDEAMALDIWIGVVEALKVSEQDIIKDLNNNNNNNKIKLGNGLSQVGDAVYFYTLNCTKQTIQ